MRWKAQGTFGPSVTPPETVAWSWGFLFGFITCALLVGTSTMAVACGWIGLGALLGYAAIFAGVPAFVCLLIFFWDRGWFWATVMFGPGAAIFAAKFLFGADL